MKNLLFLFLSLSIFFIGCENDALFHDAEVDADLKSGHVKMVPLKGIIHSNVTIYDEGVPVVGTLSGKVSHLGELITENSLWNTTSLTIDEDSWTINWEMTGAICAANGDLLYYTLTGDFSIPGNVITGQAIFSGGTGRFEFAEGSMDFTGYADNPMAITTMYMTGEGMLSNVGSSKKE